jgi:hypothetical protein
MLSWEFDQEPLSNLIPIKNLNRRNPIGHHVKYQHSVLRFEGYISVTRSVCALWFRQHIERPTEIVVTAAPINDGDIRNLRGEPRFALSDKKLLKLRRQCREHIYEQFLFFVRHKLRVYRIRRTLKPASLAALPGPARFPIAPRPA